MWIVRLALRRPYTFIVASILLLILGTVAIVRTPTDIFPNIDIPVVSVLWTYNGLSPEEMSNRIVFNYERFLTTTVNDIEHVESQSWSGRAIVKIFFHPGVNIGNAVAQITATSQTAVRSLPPGTQPPLVIQYNASSVPILQLALSGEGLSEQQLGDLGLNFLRTGLVTVPGIAIPYPYGGKQRQVEIDLNPSELQSKGLSAVDVVNAVNVQNLILPAGTAKIGSYEYQVDMNGAPQTIQELNDLPIKTDSSVAILSYSPLGDNHLEIKPGSAQAALASPGSQLNAKPYMGFNDLAEQISNLSPQAQELMANLNLRVKELSVTIARVNDLLNDRNRANLSASLAHVNGMLAEDRPLIKSTLGNVNTASRKIEPLLDKLSKTTDQANETLKHVDGMIGDNRADVRASVVKLRESLETVSVLTKRLNRTLDVNSENIDEILENMRKVSENLQEFTELIKTRPSSLINYSGPREHRPGELP